MPGKRKRVVRKFEVGVDAYSDAALDRLKAAPKYTSMTETDLWRLAVVKLAETLPAMPRNGR